MARWHSANVLQVASDAKRLWQFTVRGNTPNLSREESKLPTEPLPSKLVGKDWQTLYKPKLNIAWLPSDRAFLRVLQLPPAETLAETASMVELQLEKISPLPATQIVWTFEVLPKREGQAQTVIVVIAARNTVEEFLGKLEAESYLADRLEVPFIDQLLATKITGDGVWVFPGAGVDENNCLIVWWYGGVLQNVSLQHLPPPEERGAFLSEQISQMTWAGELEGWITSPPRRHLVADSATEAIWRPLLQEGYDSPIEILAPQPAAETAKLTARRATRPDAQASLVPPEFVARYRQMFVDRIWMRSVFAIALVYLFGVIIYLGYVQVMDFQISKLEQAARNLSPGYTNSIRLKDQARVLQDQLNLQFAALECYKAVAEKIPEGVTIDGINFSKGKTLALFGTASREALPKVNEFSDALRRSTTKGEPLFKSVSVPSTTIRGDQVGWNFTADMAKGEGE